MGYNSTNLDQISNLDTIWTGFFKTDAEIPDKILRGHTRESLLKIIANKKVCEILRDGVPISLLT
jgi:hypothetical protein